MKILFVEDEIKLAMATKRALELQNYAVDLAHDGEVGLDLALDNTYDLMILDIMLPKLDGISICKQVRAANIFVPILMLTAKGQIDDKVNGLDAGADDYLVKPFSLEELFARIRSLLRRTAPMQTSIIQVDDLEMDLNSMKVRRNNKVIDLSAKEFAILEYLLRHKNTVISREKIIDHVWNYDADVLPSTVEVHIKHLRDKIDTKESKQIIKTVRGFGYELIDEE